MPAADYLADAGNDVPTLNSTVARILLAESPRHAWHAHPKLNPAYRPEEKEAFDLGNAFHSMLLEGGDAFAVVDADGWRSNAAKEARDAARLVGRIPILAHQHRALENMRASVTGQLADFELPVPFVVGTPEATLVWEEDGVWLRARLDWLSHDRRHIWDLKTTKASAHPDAWSRYMFNSGFDIQCGLYRRGVKRLFGIEAAFAFVVCELEPPYAVSVIGLAPDALALADRKVSRAINLWRECMDTGYWPGYPTRTAYVDAPPWELAKWEDSSEFTEKSIVLEDAP